MHEDVPRTPRPLHPATGLVEPVHGKADGDDRHHDQAESRARGRAAALELLVGEVGLAVGRQLDLGADLLTTRADVDDDVDDEADHDQDRDQDADAAIDADGEDEGQSARRRIRVRRRGVSVRQPSRCSAGPRPLGRWCWCRWRDRGWTGGAGVDGEDVAFDRHGEPVEAPGAPDRPSSRRPGCTATRGTGTRTTARSRTDGTRQPRCDALLVEGDDAGLHAGQLTGGVDRPGLGQG